MCTHIAILVGDEPIQFLGGHLDEGESEMVGDLCVFTTTRLVRASAIASHKSSDVNVWGVGRSTLQKVEPFGATGVRERSPYDWPGAFSLKLSYPGETLTVPGDHGRSDEAFTALVSSLLDDLTR